MADKVGLNKVSESCEDKSTRSAGKRKWEGSDVLKKVPEAEPVEKRQAFKLTPPTLIHGVAKPAPKNDVETATASKKSFLRPSRLGPPVVSQSMSQSVTSTVSTPAKTTVVLCENKLQAPNHAFASNPFLKPLGDEDVDNKTSTDSNAESESNGFNDNLTPGPESTQENSFLKMTSEPTAPASESPPAGKTSGFVFGHKMSERVVQTGAESEIKEEEKTQDFVFGANLSERVKISVAESNALQTAPAESAIFNNEIKNDTKSGVNGRELEVNAAVLYNASNTKVVMPEVEIKTGEEDEKNVLQIQCKLYQYDSTNSKNWVERGRGNLRLNDLRISAQDQKFQSRLVMRTNGSLRLILNTKIWATMVVEKADTKSVRISAQTEEGEIGVFLIMGAINDADHLFRAIEYRVLHLKQLEEKCASNTDQKHDSGMEKSNEASKLDLPESSAPLDTSTDSLTTTTEATSENHTASVVSAQAADAPKGSSDPSVIVSNPIQDSGFRKEEKCSE